MPAEVKMALERKALDAGVSIVGVHSVVLIGDTVDVIYDAGAVRLLRATRTHVSIGCWTPRRAVVP